MSDRIEWARRYRIANMQPVPIPAGKKGLCIKGWQRGGHDVAAFDGDGNIGKSLPLVSRRGRRLKRRAIGDAVVFL